MCIFLSIVSNVFLPRGDWVEIILHKTVLARENQWNSESELELRFPFPRLVFYMFS